MMKYLPLALALLLSTPALAQETGAAAQPNCVIRETRLVQENNRSQVLEMAFDAGSLNQCIDAAKVLLGRETVEDFYYVTRSGGKTNHFRHPHLIQSAHLKTTRVRMEYSGQDAGKDSVIVKFKHRTGIFGDL